MVKQTDKEKKNLRAILIQFFLPVASLCYQPKQELAQHAKIELGPCRKHSFLFLMFQVVSENSNRKLTETGFLSVPIAHNIYA